MILNFKFGVPRQQKVWAKNVVYYGRPSQGILPVGPVVQALTDTIDNMKNPINCVLIGHQQPNKKAMGLEGISGPMKGIFGE